MKKANLSIMILTIAHLLFSHTMQAVDKSGNKNNSVTLENKFLKITISPDGAIISSFQDKLRQIEDVKMLPVVGGLNEIRNFDRYNSKKRGRQKYQLKKELIPDGTQKVIATTKIFPDEDKSLSLTVIKEYMLPKESSYLQVALEIRNHGETEIGEIPWVRHLLNRGLKELAEEAHISEYGVFQSGRPSPQNPSITPFNIHYFPAANWTSRVVMPVNNKSNTFATILNPGDIFKIYNWKKETEDFSTQEVIAAPMFVKPGQSTRWDYCFVNAAPVRNIVYCSPDLIIGMTPHPTWIAPDTKKIQLTLASTKKLDDLQVNWKLLSLDSKKVMLESTFKMSVSPDKVFKYSIPVCLKDKKNYQLCLTFSRKGKDYHPGQAVKDCEPVIIPIIVGSREKAVKVFPKSPKSKSRLRTIEPRTIQASLVASSKNFDVFMTPASKRVFKKDNFISNNNSSPAKLYASAAEYESLQLVIQPKEDSIEVWQVAASNLTGPAGGIIKPESVNKFIYVPTEIPSQYNTMFPIGEYPEGLLPTTELSIQKGDNTPLFITYHTPLNAVPGIYRGKVTFTRNGNEVVIPVEMTVWNIVMPKRNKMDVASSLKGNTISGIKHPDGRPYTRKEQLDLIVDMHLKYRITPCDSGLSRLLIQGKFDSFDKEMRKFIDAGASKIYLGSIKGLFKRYKKNNLQNAELHLKAKGWNDYFYVRPGYDEASPDKVPEIRKVCLKWKKISSIPIMETYYPDARVNELFGCLDIWCRSPIVNDWVRKRIKEGDKFWKVNAMPGILEREPWVSARRRYIEYWDNYITGTYIWTVKAWQCVKKWGEDYWSDAGVGNLCAVLMWPYKNGILSTIRLEAMRDGLEDNTLMWMLRHKYNSVKDLKNLTPEQEQAVQAAKRICDSGPLFPTINSVQDMEELRLNVGNTLSALNTLFPEKK